MRLTLLAALLLSSLPAAATPPKTRVLLDAPLALTAVPASSGVETEVAAWPGVRLGALAPLVGPLVAGGDIGLLATLASSGTDVVAVTRVLGAVEARGLLGLSFGGRFARVVPYLSLGAVGMSGPALVHGGASDAARLVVAGGARGGGGLLFTLGFVALRAELGGGVLMGRPEATTSLALGVAL